MIKEWVDNNIKGDPVIWFIVIALSVLSILVVYSATGTLAYNRMEGNTEHYLIKHSLLVMLSLFAMWVAHRIDYRYYAKLSKVALIISVPILLITWKFGMNINEASRWITIPFINQAFQPSDLAKFALFVTLASMLAKRQDNIKDIKESLIPMLLWIGGICGLIAMTNLSSAALIFATCMVVMFIGRVPVQYLVLLVVVGLIAGATALAIGQRGATAVSRIEAFVSNDDKDIPFQAEQSYIAIANGGLVRFAPGKSQQKNFLPHPYSDFIFAIIVEEYGALGGVIVLFLYIALLYRGMRLMSTSGTYGGLLAAALSFALVLQALVNMAVAVGLVPVTGLTLPMVSMGGTSQLFVGVAIGIILSVSRGEQEEIGSPSENKVRNEVGLA
ncbi:MAG: FtsW/RodA/SpoVE family cell cycle protein [Reichenbachiella sp.]